MDSGLSSLASSARKAALSWAGSVLATLLSCAVSACLPAQTRTVDTPLAVLRLSDNSGDLIGVRWKNPDLEVIGEPRLGENFRIVLPQEGYEGNYFNSRDQKVSKIAVTPDGVLCTYDSLKNERETVPLAIRYRIQVAAEQIHFSIEVDNPTDRRISEVMYGIVGGQQGIGNRLDTESLVPSWTSNLAPKLFSRFNGGGYGGGNLGIRYDAGAFTYPGAMQMGWMDVYNPKAGLGYYYANQDVETRLTLLEVELRPFSRSASVRDSWPTPADAGGEPIGITIGWVNFPYVSHGTFRAGPVALQVHNGDWHAASKIYRSWFDQHFNIDRPPDWLRKENAWQSIILSNSEDVVEHRFDELPRMAADAKKYGITTFEILGWDLGGIDRGYPQYRPNPRLGTPEEFKKALADMHALGVHPLIFSNVQFADTATPLFRDYLRQFAVEGRWAPDLQLHGWGEGTISARSGLTKSNMTLVSPAYPAYRKFLIDQYLELVREGADGFQFDKTNSLAELDFNPHLPVSPDKSLPQGLIETFQELIPAARAINPNFAIASEIWFDRVLPYVDVSYMRMGTVDMDSTAFRYTFPEWTATIFGESPGDINPMNNGMRYGLVWDLAPRHYNDSADEPLTRPLAEYVSQLIRIRKQFEDLLFFGRFNDSIGATVQGGPDIRYSVFKSMDPDNKDVASVIVNFGDTPEFATIGIDGASGEVVVAAPDLPDRHAALPLQISIPPHRLVVVVKRAAHS
jgi:hypothetical protein